MKELNIIQAMEMPIGTEFEVVLNAEEYGCHAKIIDSKAHSKKQLVWNNRADTQVFITDSISCAIFIPIQRPVSFMEVVSSDKRCRVEHKYVDVIKARTNQQSLYIADFRNDNYIPLNYLMNILGYSSSEENIRQIINEGKWYIED